MDKEILNKLMEIKELYEAGILTKEEMEAEKAKVLHPATTPNTESTQTNSSLSQQTGKSNNKWYWIGGIGIIVLIIVLVLKKNSEPTYYNEPVTEEVAESIDSPDAPTIITAEEEPKVEATETGAWAGRIVVDGGMYRNCLTSASINLISDGNNKYHGTIKIHANDGLNGYLEGDITASGSDTELTIHIIDPYVAPGDNGNVFDEPEFYKPIQKNSDIFRITKQGNRYSAKPLGNMKEYFDGIADEITVNKQ